MSIDYLKSLNTNGSGLNLSEITNSMVDAEIVPKQNRVEENIGKTEASISALGTLRQQLGQLDSALNVAKQAKALQATSNDPAIDITVTNDALLSEQKTEFTVFQVAEGQVLDFKGLSSGADQISAGSLQIDFGVWHGDTEPQSFTVNPDKAGSTLTIEAGTTLDEVAKQLNELDGISARIIRVGDGTFSLGVVTDDGAASAVRITATPSGTPAAGEVDLSILDNSITNHTKQIQQASDAMLSVDGITVFRPTNEIDDILPGMTLSLKAATDYPVDVAVKSDGAAAKETMKALLDHLNDTTKTLSALTARGVDGAPAGPLAGDPTATAMQRQLRNVMSEGLVGFSENPIYLSSLGVRTERDGTFTLDEAAFDRQFKQDPLSFEAVFGNAMRADTNGVEIDRVPMSGLAPGQYNFSRDPSTGNATFGGYPMTEISAENGITLFAVASGPNTGLRLSVEDGANSATISNGESFLSKMQNALNDALSYSGSLTRRENQLTSRVDDYMTQMTELNDLSDILQKRYIEKFSAMETMVTKMKSTGQYLSNLVAQWNKDS